MVNMSQNHDDGYEMRSFPNGPSLRFSEETPAFEEEEDSYFEYEHGMGYRHRTTSLHRNVARREQDNYRNRARSIDRRNDWVTAAATLGRQPLEKHADEIVSKIVEDLYLMEDTQQAELLRREALRDMPQSLTMKRLVKEKLLTRSRNQNSTKSHANFFSDTSNKLKRLTAKFSESGKNVMYTFELWYSSLKKIEGEFGSAIAMFFRFYRWLFMLNIFTFVPIVIFIIIPQLSNQELSAGSNEDFAFGDIFTGEGSFRDTALFYGFYTNETISFFGGEYIMPHAYFFTMLSIYVVNFIIISISTAKSYRRNFIETKGSLKNAFVQRIFTSWDFSIATRNAASLKSSSIYNELKELLDKSAPKKPETFCDRFVTFMVQASAHFIIVTSLGGTGYGMWKLLDQNRIEGEKGQTNLGIVNAVIINVIMCVVPFIFTYLIRYEGYKRPRSGFYITLGRTFFLEIVVIGVSIAYWLVHSEREVCWETSIGQEIYRLVLFDFLFSIIFLVIVDVVHKLLSTQTKRVPPPEFEMARYVLHLIYNQSLFWVGIYFSPLLGVIVILKMVITWYMITLGTLNVCNPSSKTWRAAQSHTGMFVMIFMCLVLVIVALGYIIANIHTSICGPFSHLMYVYNIIKNGILQLETGHRFWKFLIYLAKPGTVALIMLGMCVGIYYLRAKAKAQEKMVKILRDMQIKDAKDREYLLNQISKVTNGAWQYNLHDDMAEPYHTSPTAYGLINRRRKGYEIIDEDEYNSQALLPSASATTIPVEDVDYQDVFDRFKKHD